MESAFQALPRFHQRCWQVFFDFGNFKNHHERQDQRDCKLGKKGKKGKKDGLMNFKMIKENRIHGRLMLPLSI